MSKTIMFPLGTWRSDLALMEAEPLLNCTTRKPKEIQSVVATSVALCVLNGLIKMKGPMVNSININSVAILPQGQTAEKALCCPRRNVQQSSALAFHDLPRPTCPDPTLSLQNYS